MSFKVNNLGARIVKAKSSSSLESIVTLIVLLLILGGVSYPMYFYEPNFYLYVLLSMKLIMASVVIFDAVGLVKGLLKKA